MPGVVRRDSSCKISHGVEFAIAVPSSYVSVVSTLVDRTRLVSSLARACGIFRVDEIVIIDDSLNDDNNKPSSAREELVKKENNDVGGASSSTSELMHRLLTYLDTPQYLRRRLIPHHADLAYAGKMPTLDAPHQLRKTDRATYREGAVVAHTPQGAMVDVGLDEPVHVHINKAPDVNERVTVHMDDAKQTYTIVSRDTPREQLGTYWGYRVRRCRGLSECLYKDNNEKRRYDWVIGTSEHGKAYAPVDDITPPRAALKRRAKDKKTRVVLLFGGVRGLEALYMLDQARCGPLLPSSAERKGDGAEAAHLCDDYLNFCPRQGSRTIRTEEAILIGLALLRDPVANALSSSSSSSEARTSKKRKHV